MKEKHKIIFAFWIWVSLIYAATVYYIIGTEDIDIGARFMIAMMYFITVGISVGVFLTNQNNNP